jgi:nucleoid-associated protein YgaU
MPKDARLGLVVGVGLVIIVAVLFFRRESAAHLPAGSLDTPSGRSAGPVNAFEVQASAMPGVPSPWVLPRSHTVQEGETLCSLAVRYYGDAGRSSFLYRANRDRLRAPNYVPIGTVLVIPEPSQEVAASTRDR